VEAEYAGSRYRLGAPDWVVERGAAPAAGLGFSRDGRLLAWLIADEALRPGARDAVDALVQQGLEPWLLSGDDDARVKAVAAELGIAPEHARGNMKPEDKMAWLAEHGRKGALFIGDGLNDGAVDALVSGTPAADRPLRAAASDFSLIAPGLAPLAGALTAARELGVATRQLQRAGASVSGAAVLLSVAGLAHPLLVALFMPLAALTMAAWAARQLSGDAPARDRRARSAHLGPVGPASPGMPAAAAAGT